jgi:two-component system response regulator
MANILVIDEKPGVREVFARELAFEGYTVICTGDAQSVKDTIKSSKPEVVLLDLYIAGQHRWDLLADVKKEYPHLPILIITACDGYKKDPRLALADGYLIKSFYFDELKQKIVEILKRKAS